MVPSREFALVAACCRWPLTDAAITAIRGAAAAVNDWPSFLRLIARHRVAGLAQNALAAAAVATPPEFARQLAARAQAAARLSLALASETVRLQRAFEAAGIGVFVVKGAALAQLAYGSLSLKHSKDIDLFVAPGDVESALRLLQRNGYALTYPAPHLGGQKLATFVRYGREIKLLHADGGLQVELKWKLADNPRLLNGIDTNATAQTVPLSDQVSVRTLSDGDRFAYLSVHGTHHAWFRLKWLADFNALIATATDDERVRLYRYAQGAGAGLCAGQALLLCHRLLGLPLPSALHDELHSNRRLQRLVALALGALADPLTKTKTDSGLAGMTRGVRSRFLSGQGAGYVWSQWRIESVGLADIIEVALPPAFHFLYPVLRVPLWIGRRARRGLARMAR